MVSSTTTSSRSFLSDLYLGWFGGKGSNLSLLATIGCVSLSPFMWRRGMNDNNRETNYLLLGDS